MLGELIPLLRNSPWGCGAACSFVSTDVDLTRNYFFSKLRQERNRFLLPFHHFLMRIPGRLGTCHRQSLLSIWLRLSSEKSVSFRLGFPRGMFPAPRSIWLTFPATPRSHLLQEAREEARKTSLVQSVSAVLHALSSQHPESLYSIGRIDFTVEVSCSWLPHLGRERTRLFSLPTAAVSTLRDSLPPIVSRCLLGIFLF